MKRSRSPEPKASPYAMLAPFGVVFLVFTLIPLVGSLALATTRTFGPVARFVHVTLPAIRPVGSFVVLTSVIGSVQLFELPFIMLGGAGPESRGLTVVMYLYQTGFQTGDLGYASAIGWALAVVLAVAAVIQLVVSRDRT